MISAPLTTSPVVADRRMSGAALQRLLGEWRATAPGPAYVALGGAIRDQILSGALPLRTRLPGERELAATLGVSRTTTQGAYRSLREDGYLHSWQGVGTLTTVPATRTGPVPARHERPRAGSPARTIDLTIAAPWAPTTLHPAYVRALDALPHYLTGTGYDPLGLEVLREVIANRFTARGAPTTAEQILVTSGAQHALSLVLTEVVGPGDRVVVEQPTYPEAIAAVRAAGARPVAVPVGQDGTDIDQLAATVRQVAPRAVYLVPDHHNPTGTSIDAAGRAAVRELARRHRTLVIVDETLTELTLDGAPPPPLVGSADDGGPQLVTIGSASKAFWGGLRIGWLRAHPDLVRRLAASRAAIDIATAVLEQLVVAELVSDLAATMPERHALLRERRDSLVEAVRTELPEWRFTSPRGGQSLWVDLGRPVSTPLCVAALRRGVAVSPGPDFAVDGGLQQFLRLPYTLGVEDLARAVRVLAESWATLGPAPGRVRA